MTQKFCRRKEFRENANAWFLINSIDGEVSCQETRDGIAPLLTGAGQSSIYPRQISQFDAKLFSFTTSLICFKQCHVRHSDLITRSVREYGNKFRRLIIRTNCGAECKKHRLGLASFPLPRTVLIHPGILNELDPITAWKIFERWASDEYIIEREN